MLNRIFTNVLGSRNHRVLRQLWKSVDKINAFEPQISALTDEKLRAKTAEFRLRLQNGSTIDHLLPEAFAVVRETAKRTLNMRHFDVQLIGGMVLHNGSIAEMRTGEGKTLVATLAAYLNALPGAGVHIVTVNDYLARRDADWMRPLYEFLGLSVSVNLTGMSPADKQIAYRADIVYGTNNEFGFDYLRDNMVFALNEKVQRGLNFAIVDEVDSILIDEARTPLIISGAAEESVDLYRSINDIIPLLQKQAEKDGPGDYSLDEKSKQAHLTEAGHLRVEELLSKAKLISEGESLYDAQNIMLMHHIYAALRANALFHRDVDYIVTNNEVVIVDEHTGRTMPGRRWSEGLHQAIEAKEKVKINQENQTLASITFQNYFRLYQKLSGMTGTADTEAYEFQQIYGLEVIVIPTHKDMVRKDNADFVYMSADEKYAAIVADIKKTYEETKQPILVGTTSIESSELLSDLLRKAKIPHQVLNAKFHEKEAQIVAEAGRPGAVTIATNMAGRGTDIVLGGNLEAELKALDNLNEAEIDERRKAWLARHEQVVQAGGLYVLGTERHESRRIDNQLRGRSGRQGDPGKSRFYLSLHDNLLRIFGGDRLNTIMQRIGMEKGVALESRMLSRSIENAQRKVEAYNFDVRKQLLEYDDVANDQRKVIYRQRDELLEATEIADMIRDISVRVIDQVINIYIPPHSMEEIWQVEDLAERLRSDFNLSLPLMQWLEDKTVDEEKLRAKIQSAFQEHYQAKETQIGLDIMRQFEKAVMLQTLDTCWREHLAAMDYLRQGIHLRGYAQKNPKQEYKRESFELFAELLDKVNHQVISALTKFEVKVENDIERMQAKRQQEMNLQHMQYQHAEIDALQTDNTGYSNVQEVEFRSETYMRNQPKIGRNDPCPCGSKKKYKQCHGKLNRVDV